MNDITDQFTRIKVEMHGPQGAEWVNRLPGLIAQCERRWALTVYPPFEHLTYNYVAAVARWDGTAAVLKLGFPNREFKTEIEALRSFEGRGSVRLLDADPEQGVLLLEQL